MKIRHILINILPLPLWVIYYLVTISNKELFMMPIDESVSLIMIIAFTIYNLFSKRVRDFLIRNFCIFDLRFHMNDLILHFLGSYLAHLRFWK